MVWWVNEWANGHMGRCMYVYVGGWVDGWGGWINGWETDGWIVDGWINGDRWIDGLMDGWWLGRWMDEWMVAGWMDE